MKSEFLKWAAGVDLSWWQVILVAYGITGLFSLALEIPFFINEWRNFDKRLEDKMSSLEIEQMSSSTYTFAKVTSISLAMAVAWLLWPFVRANK